MLFFVYVNLYCPINVNLGKLCQLTTYFFCLALVLWGNLILFTSREIYEKCSK